ncbi:hypothetical protein JRQ81_007009 [Phrynocephalus forsythii]|uniref:RCC1 domain-containing protein 1 n=1 Tax=Phrynocephalus forsythii TaxID=171643 RepID=A0A9Q1AUH7_9SAUR|nr:hypothetical protein JRQ81_007009 [Phrynocephalus forsythii]
MEEEEEGGGGGWRGRQAAWFQFGFRFGLATEGGLQPVPLGEPGTIRGVRPSWSFVGILTDGSAAGAAARLEGSTGRRRRRCPATASTCCPRRATWSCCGRRRWKPGRCRRRAPALLSSWQGSRLGGGISSPRTLRRRPQKGREGAAAGRRRCPWCPAGSWLRGRLSSTPCLAPSGLARWPWATSTCCCCWRRAERSSRGEAAETGDLYLWGWNESGQLALPSKAMSEDQEITPRAEASKGDSEQTLAQQEVVQGTRQAAFISIQAFPALVEMPQGEDVSKISCGSRHTAAVTCTGQLYTWGWGKYGQLGHQETASSDQPRRVSCFVDWDMCVVDVVCGPWTTYTLAVSW